MWKTSGFTLVKNQKVKKFISLHIHVSSLQVLLEPLQTFAFFDALSRRFSPSSNRVYLPDRRHSLNMLECILLVKESASIA